MVIHRLVEDPDKRGGMRLSIYRYYLEESRAQRLLYVPQNMLSDFSGASSTTADPAVPDTLDYSF